MKEQIICSAIWYKEVIPRAAHRPINTPGGVVLCGFRHGDIISQVLPLIGKRQFELGEHVQGFLTNKNRFVNRHEAAIIHIANGHSLKYHSLELFSEDLY